VEIMGSEGYLINEFIAAHTNQRDDEWGGSYENRIRFPLEIVRRTRERVGSDFIIIFRLSMLDLVEAAPRWDEVVQLAQALEAGRRHHHQHRHRLARGAHSHHRHQGAARRVCLGDAMKLKGKVGIPLVATNRINTPEVAEQVLADGWPTW
jgi:2,4-dienoyl-CoA reductase (NADPH2)